MAFFLNQLLKGFILYSVQYFSGLLVKYKGVKVNYTRKINHFVLFFVPVYIDRVFAYEDSFGLFSLGASLAFFSLLIYLEPVRKRVPLFSTMFMSFDRPEDRPHTLLWLYTQIAAGFLVMLPMIFLFSHFNLLDWMFIPLLINGIGDGLAEPVGVRFGRHAYRTRALFTRKQYRRTLEGSACVFFSSIVIIAFSHAYFTPAQFTAALLALPLLMTLAEAYSPHTWDTPFLFLVGYLVLFGISFIH